MKFLQPTWNTSGQLHKLDTSLGTPYLLLGLTLLFAFKIASGLHGTDTTRCLKHSSDNLVHSEKNSITLFMQGKMDQYFNVVCAKR